MHSSSILLATLAATVSATIPLHKRFVEARQTDVPSASLGGASPSATENSACLAAEDDVYSIIAAAPTVPDDLYSFAVTATDIETADLCTYTFPTAIASEWSSYSAAYESWLSGTASAELQSIASVCGTSLDPSDIALCTATDGGAAAETTTSDSTSTSTTKSEASGLTTSKSGTITKTTAPGSSETAQATSTSTAGAGAREVGTIGVFFAGLLGAVAAL